MGILFVLLHCGRLLDSDPTVRDDVFESIAYVMGQECDVPDRPRQGGYFPVLMDLAGPRPPQPDSPPLVHWCHGPPGAVFLFAKAFKVRGAVFCWLRAQSASPAADSTRPMMISIKLTPNVCPAFPRPPRNAPAQVRPDPSYLAVAERAAQLVWERGLLRKGWGLCHGISGNAYALLYLWRMLEECTAAAAGGPSTATGGNVEAAAAAAARPSPTAVVQAAVSGRAKWLHRARQFALFLQTPQGASVAAKPDNALSLFEGQAGALCLLADVLEAPAPTHARGFPFFQL